jgi:hypothetical protein
VCAGDGFCDFFNTDPAVCRAAKAEGEMCNSGNECAQPALCKYDPENDDGRCFRPRDEGEPCDPDSYDTQCARFDNVCHPVDRVCAPLPTKNDACPRHECAGDFFCSQTQGVRCVPVADAGERCGYLSGDDVPCSGDTYCDYSVEPSTCKVLSGESGCPVPVVPGQGG